MRQEIILSATLDSQAIIIKFEDFDSCATGYKASEVIGKNWFEVFIPQSNLQEMQKVFDGFFKGNLSFWEYENEITCKDGTKKRLKWKNALRKDAHYNPIAIYSEGYLN